MRALASLALGAGMLAVSAIAAAEPASARGNFGVYIGPGGYGPGYYGGPSYRYSYRDYCRDWRFRRRHPYECDRYYGAYDRYDYDDAYYDEPYYGGGYYPGIVFGFGGNFGHHHRGHSGHNWGGHWNGGHGNWNGGHGHGHH